jgi:hypothetical protein
VDLLKPYLDSASFSAGRSEDCGLGMTLSLGVSAWSCDRVVGTFRLARSEVDKQAIGVYIKTGPKILCGRVTLSSTVLLL